MFEWTNRYSVGIVTIDAEHKKLFAIAAELHNAVLAGQDNVACGNILDRLVQYTDTHFAHEEWLMQSHCYPSMARHKAEHDDLTRKVLHLQSDFKAGPAMMTVGVMQFLKGWLEGHILVADAKYAPYLRDQAVA